MWNISFVLEPSLPHQNIPRLCSISRPDDSAAFHNIHHARRLGIAQSQTPLKERGARFVFGDDDLDALENEPLRPHRKHHRHHLGQRHRHQWSPGCFARIFGQFDWSRTSQYLPPLRPRRRHPASVPTWLSPEAKRACLPYPPASPHLWNPESPVSRAPKKPGRRSAKECSP